MRRCSIEVSVRCLHESTSWVRTVSATRLRTKSMKKRQSSSWRNPKRTSKGLALVVAQRCAVEVAVGTHNKGTRESAVAAVWQRTKGIDWCQHAGGSNFEN